MDAAHEWTDEQIEALERKFGSIYRQAQREMRSKLGKHMASFEKASAEWARRVKKDPALQEEYESWLSDCAADRRWMRGMVTALTEDAVRANQMAADAINDAIPAVYAENANRAAYAIESGLGRDIGAFTLVDESTVRTLIKDDPDLVKEIEPDKKRDYTWNRRKFNAAITQSVLQGESVMDAAKRIQRVIGMDSRAAVRSARTALTSAENAGRVSSYRRAQEVGVKLEQEWMATLDMRTRDSHRLMDGQHVTVGQKFPNGLEYPGDPKGPGEEVWNCRCTLVAWFPGIGQEDPDRWAKLPKGMTYEQWRGAKAEEAERKESHGIVDGKDILGIWTRRPDEFDFEIEDVMAAQGFDGLPRVVGSDEFDTAVKAANGGNGLVMQRTYSAPDKETLDAYRDTLYEGKWYVDCSEGGSQFGQGMYAVSDFDGKITEGMEHEINLYVELGETKGRKTFVDLPEDKQLKLIREKAEETGATGDALEAVVTMMRYELQYGSVPFEEASKAHELARGYQYSWKIEELRTYRSKPESYIETMTLDPSAKIVDYRDVLDMHSKDGGSMDLGAYAAMRGYDAIVANGAGTSGSYTVVLNRTKVIIRRPD